MKIKKTPLEGFFVIELDCFQDSRGFFLETYQEHKYNQIGITDKFVQDNQSRSAKGVLRGMHFQGCRPQAQIVTVLRGQVFDVGVDLRLGSKTYGQWHGVELGGEGQRQIYMAPGFAHGFFVLSNWADLHYKVSRKYNPEDESGFFWNDPDVEIQWPTKYPILSAKDKQLKYLRDL